MKGDPLTGLEYALCALSFFRNRHGTRSRYKHPSKRHEGMTVPVYRDYVRNAREYVRLARDAGWRGSIRKAMTRGMR